VQSRSFSASKEGAQDQFGTIAFEEILAFELRENPPVPMTSGACAKHSAASNAITV